MQLKIPHGAARIGVSGVFDMSNYGDLLFPLIARHRLESAGVEIIPIAPTSQSSGIGDALDPTGITPVLLGDEPLDGMIIGGGYIIHACPMDFLDSYALGEAGDWAAASLWLGATLAAALSDIPLVWNAPGVLFPFVSRQRPIINAALAAADYVSVRDRGSRALLAAPEGINIANVVDPIADLARMWPLESLAADFGRFTARKQVFQPERLLALHVRNRSLRGVDMAEFAATLDAFAAAHELTPVLMAIGASHDDPGVARALSARLSHPHILLDDPTGLREITAVLAHARLYVGASLHGYIAAASYGIPGVLVARPAYKKFSGFLDHCDRPQDLARDWDFAFELGSERACEPRSQRIPDAALAALDRHWDAIRTGLAEPGNKRAQRAAFLASTLREGLRTGGPGWALRPFLNRISSGQARRSPTHDPVVEKAAL